MHLKASKSGGESLANGGRPDNARFRSQFLKTRPCRFFALGRCRATNGECPFSHGSEELHVLPDLTKTSICQKWSRGKCPFSSKDCSFAHGISDLRTTSAYGANDDNSDDELNSDLGNPRPGSWARSTTEPWSQQQREPSEPASWSRQVSGDSRSTIASEISAPRQRNCGMEIIDDDSDDELNSDLVNHRPRCWARSTTEPWSQQHWDPSKPTSWSRQVSGDCRSTITNRFPAPPLLLSQHISAPPASVPASSKEALPVGPVRRPRQYFGGPEGMEIIAPVNKLDGVSPIPEECSFAPDISDLRTTSAYGANDDDSDDELNSDMVNHQPGCWARSTTEPWSQQQRAWSRQVSGDSLSTIASEFSAPPLFWNRQISAPLASVPASSKEALPVGPVRRPRRYPRPLQCFGGPGGMEIMAPVNKFDGVSPIHAEDIGDGLDGLKLGELKRMAKVAGVTRAKIEGVDDTDDPLKAIKALIVSLRVLDKDEPLHVGDWVKVLHGLLPDQVNDVGKLFEVAAIDDAQNTPIQLKGTSGNPWYKRQYVRKEDLNKHFIMSHTSPPNYFQGCANASPVPRFDGVQDRQDPHDASLMMDKRFGADVRKATPQMQLVIDLLPGGASSISPSELAAMLESTAAAVDQYED